LLVLLFRFPGKRRERKRKSKSKRKKDPLNNFHLSAKETI